MEKVKLEISWTTLWRIFVFAIIVSVFYLGRQIFLGLFLAIIISSGLEGMVDFLARRGVPRSISVIIIFLLIIGVITFIIYSILPVALVELNTILSEFGKTSGGLSFLASLKSSKSLSLTLSNLSSEIFSGNTSPLQFFSNTLGSFGLAAAVVISSFYLSLTKDGVDRFIKLVSPPDYEANALRIYERAKQKLGAWFRMQILLTLIMALTVWVGLTFLGVPYAFLLACIAGIFELVPFLGPILSGALSVVAAFGVSSTLAIYTLVFFVVAQQFESNILIPLLSRHSVGLHPVIAIVALLIGAEVGGILGIVIAIPASAVFQEMIEEWSINKRATLSDSS